MHAERASGTALLVTALRALASTGDAPLISDPHATRFLPRSWARAIGLPQGRPRTARLLRSLADAVSPGRLQHIALRTRVIDDALGREVARGTRQIVLLGAGFDARAYRLDALRDARVLELDHPATQARKRRLARHLVPLASEHRFLSIDLERDELRTRLLAAPFEPTIPSIFVWEGVTMYLSLAAIHSTLAAVTALMATGSLLIASYYDSSGASGPPSRATTGLAALLGERFRTRLSPTGARDLTQRFGLVVESDGGRDDWARLHAQVPRGRAQERVLFARRTSS